MIYRVNLNWTASINKIVEIEAGTKEEALETALDCCIDHASFSKDQSDGSVSYESFIKNQNPDAILWNNPDSVEYMLEDEACAIVLN